MDTLLYNIYNRDLCAIIVWLSPSLVINQQEAKAEAEAHI